MPPSSRTAKNAAKSTARGITKRTADRAVERAVESAVQMAAQRIAERAAEKIAERAAEEATKRAANKAADNAAQWAQIIAQYDAGQDAVPLEYRTPELVRESNLLRQMFKGNSDDLLCLAHQSFVIFATCASPSGLGLDANDANASFAPGGTVLDQFTVFAFLKFVATYMTGKYVDNDPALTASLMLFHLLATALDNAGNPIPPEALRMDVVKAFIVDSLRKARAKDTGNGSTWFTIPAETSILLEKLFLRD